MTASPEEQANGARKFGCLQVGLISLVLMILTAVVTWWILRTYIFPSQFEPVTLSQKEERVLQKKIDRFEGLKPVQRGRGALKRSRTLYDSADHEAEPLAPLPYSEEGADRGIRLSERELNALLAKNTDLAEKLAIDLADDLVSARLLIPLEEDFPILGGKTLKVRAGVNMAFRDGRPVVVLKGVSIMGVPIPNAWLGGLKNIDLIQEFGSEPGFWQAFADGVRSIDVEDGSLVVELKE